jgi:hypothetical protein
MRPAKKTPFLASRIPEMVAANPGITWADLRHRCESLVDGCDRSTANKAISICVEDGFIRTEPFGHQQFKCYPVDDETPNDDRVIRRSPAEWFHMERIMPKFADPISWGMHHCLRMSR